MECNLTKTMIYIENIYKKYMVLYWSKMVRV